MISMIAKKRADFMFISYKEAFAFIKTHKYKNKIKFLKVLGLPKVNEQYLMCSKSVSDEIINKINGYIK